MKILDSTFLIDLIRGEKETFKVLSSKQPLLTTQINMYEVIKGLFLRDIGGKKLIGVMELFDEIRVLPLDDSAIIKSASICSELIKKGLEIDDFDCITSGIAISKGINTIVTRNREHFKRIKNIKVETY